MLFFWIESNLGRTASLGTIFDREIAASLCRAQFHEAEVTPPPPPCRAGNSVSALEMPTASCQKSKMVKGKIQCQVASWQRFQIKLVSICFCIHAISCLCLEECLQSKGILFQFAMRLQLADGESARFPCSSNHGAQRGSGKDDKRWACQRDRVNLPTTAVPIQWEDRSQLFSGCITLVSYKALRELFGIFKLCPESIIWLWFPCSNLVNSIFYRLCHTFLQDSGMPDEDASENAASGPDPCPALALPFAAPLGSLLCQSIEATAEELTMPGFRTAVETGTENPQNTSKDDPKFREIGRYRRQRVPWSCKVLSMWFKVPSYHIVSLDGICHGRIYRKARLWEALAGSSDSKIRQLDRIHRIIANWFYSCPPQQHAPTQLVSLPFFVWLSV